MRQHFAIAVENQAPVRDDGRDGYPVGFRQGVIVLLLGYLQIKETRKQQQEERQNEARTDGEPEPEIIQLIQMVTKLYSAAHRASEADLGFCGALNTEERNGHSNMPVTLARKKSHPGKGDPSRSPARSMMTCPENSISPICGACL